MFSAIGNRAWGHGWRAVGVIMMTLGIWLGREYPLWAMGPIAACVFLWRSPSPRPWFHIMWGQRGSWWSAIYRGLWVLPLAVVLWAIDGHWYHLAIGVLGVGAIPVIYWLSGLYKKQPVELAECLAGCYLGVI